MDNVSGTEYGTIVKLGCPEPDDVLMWGWAYAMAMGAVKCVRLPIKAHYIVGNDLNGSSSSLREFGVNGTWPLVCMSYVKYSRPTVVTDKNIWGSANSYAWNRQTIYMDTNNTNLDTVYWRQPSALLMETNGVLWTSWLGR